MIEPAHDRTERRLERALQDLVRAEKPPHARRRLNRPRSSKERSRLKAVAELLVELEEHSE